MNPEECGALEVHPWQRENYRLLETGVLFSRLNELGILIDEDGLAAYVDECTAPEELVLCVLPNEEGEVFEKAYLLFFELWRRLFPDKQSLSIFCDELDHTIEAYHKGVVCPDDLVTTIADLERVLDDNSDHGVDPKVVFESVGSNMAHDLESFLFDFISLQIDSGNETYASELIEELYPYVARDHWFDFLRIRLASLVDMEEASYMLSHLLDKLEEKQDKELLFEALEFLVQFGESSSYLCVFSMLLNLIESKEEYEDLLSITSSYFTRYSMDDHKSSLDKMAKKMARRKSAGSVSEKDLHELREITFTGLKSI